VSQKILEEAINPALSRLEGHRIPVSDMAKAMLLAIGLQESNLTHRFQTVPGKFPRGPARGLFQFEALGGVRGVLQHTSTATIAEHFALEFVGSTQEHAVWASLAYEDVLAAIFARLFIWTDPRLLPPASPAGESAGWQIYNSVWRPGKPHPDRWPANWRSALDIINASTI